MWKEVPNGDPNFSGDININQLECLVKTPRGRLQIRSAADGLDKVIKLLDEKDSLEVGLKIIAELCKDCDAALEFGQRGLHPVLSRLTRTCTGECLDLVFQAVQAAVSGLPPGHAFPMSQGLAGMYPPLPHILHLPSATLQVRCDTSLRLHSQGDVGRLLWPSAMVMARWLLRTAPSWLPPSSSLSSCKLLELGAGVGVTGLAASLLVGHVTLSDYDPNVLANLHYNVSLLQDSASSTRTNSPPSTLKSFALPPQSSKLSSPPLQEETSSPTSPGRPSSLHSFLPRGHTLEVVHMDWKHLSSKTEKYDVILGSDVVCSASDGEAVAGAVAALLSHTGKAYLLLPPVHVRWGVEVLTRAARDLGLVDTIEKVAREDVQGVEEEGEEREEDIAIGGGYEDTLQLHVLTWKS